MALADNNQEEPCATHDVLQFTDGYWQDSPYLLAPQPCPTGDGTGVLSSLRPVPTKLDVLRLKVGPLGCGVDHHGDQLVEDLALDVR
jgi:hypothetical protein